MFCTFFNLQNGKTLVERILQLRFEPGYCHLFFYELLTLICL